MCAGPWSRVAWWHLGSASFQTYSQYASKDDQRWQLLMPSTNPGTSTMLCKISSKPGTRVEQRNSQQHDSPHSLPGHERSSADCLTIFNTLELPNYQIFGYPSLQASATQAQRKRVGNSWNGAKKNSPNVTISSLKSPHAFTVDPCEQPPPADYLYFFRFLATLLFLVR